MVGGWQLAVGSWQLAEQAQYGFTAKLFGHRRSRVALAAIVAASALPQTGAIRRNRDIVRRGLPGRIGQSAHLNASTVATVAAPMSQPSELVWLSMRDTSHAEVPAPAPPPTTIIVHAMRMSPGDPLMSPPWPRATYAMPAAVKRGVRLAGSLSVTSGQVPPVRVQE